MKTSQAQQLGEIERLLRELVELRGRQIDSTTASRQHYDRLHGAGYLRQRHSFYMWLLSLLKPSSELLLLDISCGQGALLQAATQAGLYVAGLELSPEAGAMASRVVPSAQVSLANAERLPYADNTFDYATNIGSLEHYFHPHWAVREMARVLRPDGIAMLLLPNTFGLLGNILHVWRTGDVFDDGQSLQRYGTSAQWHRLLELNGLEVTRTIKHERELPRTRADLLWYLRRPYRLGRVILAPLIPLNLSSFLVYLCRKTV